MWSISKMCRNIVVSDAVKSERVGRGSYCTDPYTAPRSLVRGVYLTPSNLWWALITRLNQRSTRFLQTRPLNCFHIHAHGTLLGPGMAGWQWGCYKFLPFLFESLWNTLWLKPVWIIHLYLESHQTTISARTWMLKVLLTSYVYIYSIA